MKAEGAQDDQSSPFVYPPTDGPSVSKRFLEGLWLIQGEIEHAAKRKRRHINKLNEDQQSLIAEKLTAIRQAGEVLHELEVRHQKLSMDAKRAYSNCIRAQEMNTAGASGKRQSLSYDNTDIITEAQKVLTFIRNQRSFCSDRIKDQEAAIQTLKSELRDLEITAKEIAETHEIQLLRIEPVLRHVKTSEEQLEILLRRG